MLNNSWKIKLVRNWNRMHVSHICDVAAVLTKLNLKFDFLQFVAFGMSK